MNITANIFESTIEELPRFIRVLYDMVEDVAYNDVIRWGHSGTAIEIVDVQAMSDIVLPKYFSHQKFTSFKRQLNYFGFRKWTKTQTDICTFSHPDFLQYDQIRACMIRRGKRTSTDTPETFTPKRQRTESIPIIGSWINSFSPKADKGRPGPVIDHDYRYAQCLEIPTDPLLLNTTWLPVDTLLQQPIDIFDTKKGNTIIVL